MHAARGDRKPCTAARCTGTMQFGREPQAGLADVMASGNPGWVCSEDSDHFRAASVAGDPRRTESTASEHWDDDGGAGRTAPKR